MATAVLGMQWGDEGKGKVTHLLAKDATMVVRFNGGPNAGHTVIDRGVRFGTHLVPAGVFYPDVLSVLASGVVIDLSVLRQEVEEISRHLGWRPRLLISEAAHLILPYHRLLEDLEGMAGTFGTTRRGIAPVYRDRAAKVGIRSGDLLSPPRLRRRLDERMDLLKRLAPRSPEIDALSGGGLAEELLRSAEPFLNSIGDAAGAIGEALARDEAVLFEGAQGALLDLDFGTYPFVTSSSTTFAGLANGIGVPLLRVDCRIGVIKAYTTRVGEGAFPTELVDEVGETLRREGAEFGTTTGRPRRCGWLDLVALRHAAAFDAPTGLAVTKLDVLSGSEEIKLCRAYRLGGRETTRFPLAAEDLAECQPVYETVPGWREDLSGMREYDELPKEARSYLARIAEGVGAPIAYVSLGPSAEETIATGFDSE